MDVDVRVIVCMVALSTSTISVPFLMIWTVSPSLRLDLSKSDFKINVDLIKSSKPRCMKSDQV